MATAETKAVTIKIPRGQFIDVTGKLIRVVSFSANIRIYRPDRRHSYQWNGFTLAENSVADCIGIAGLKFICGGKLDDCEIEVIHQEHRHPDFAADLKDTAVATARVHASEVVR